MSALSVCVCVWFILVYRSVLFEHLQEVYGSLLVILPGISKENHR
jgi:hypothetical protein